MKRSILAFVAFLAMFPMFSFAQTAFRIELEAGGEVFQAGRNALLICDSTYNGTIKVYSADPGSGRTFCASSVEVNLIVPQGSAKPIMKSKIENPTIIEGGCSFPFVINTPTGGISFEFNVYETVNGKKITQKMALKDRYIGIKCKK